MSEKKEDGSINEALKQVAIADKIILNKIDLVTPSTLDIIQEQIRWICLIVCDFDTLSSLTIYVI